MKELILMIATAVVLSGCTTIGQDVNIEPLIFNEVTTNKHKYSYIIATNYKIGEELSSNIGSTMIKVDDYLEDNVTIDVSKENEKTGLGNHTAFISSYDFEIAGAFQTRKNVSVPITTNKYRANSIFNIIGTLMVDDDFYYVIDMNKSAHKFLVTRSGSLVTNRFLNVDDDHYNFTPIDLKTTPNKIKFDFHQQTVKIKNDDKRNENKYYKNRIDNSARLVAAINYELIYGGKDSTGLHIVYREFTGEGMAKQAFFQNLNYETKAKSIRFKNTNIEVISADNEKIVFKVLEDDIAKLEKKGIDNLPETVTTKTVIKK